eukprot:677429-Rhodomonas_salina.1
MEFTCIGGGTVPPALNSAHPVLAAYMYMSFFKTELRPHPRQAHFASLFRKCAADLGQVCPHQTRNIEREERIDVDTIRPDRCTSTRIQLRSIVRDQCAPSKGPRSGLSLHPVRY